MTRRHVGLVLFILGAALAVGAVLLGRFGLPELQGGVRLDELAGTPAMHKLSLFGYGFPLGLGLCLTGAALLGDAGRARAGLFGLLACAGPGVMSLVPRLFGTAPSPAYFGVGGSLILVLFLLSAWQWGAHRLRLRPEARLGADLLAAGYLCFGLAAWNACGAGGMPGFALRPERMAAIGSQAFAVAHTKIVMAFFVLGWLFTLLGLRLHRPAR
jgi:hypothetical protein